MPQPAAACDPHVAVLAFPFSTHAAPLLSIISRLASSAPHTHFSFFSTAESNNSLFSTHKHYFLPNVKAYNVSNGVPEDYVFVGKPQEDIELFLKAAPENLRKAVAEAAVETGRKVSCLVNDGFLWFAAEMAKEMEVPFVPCWLSGSSSLSAHFYTDLIRETIGLEGIEGREDEQLKFIPGMSKVQIRDLPEGVLFGNLQSVFSHMLHQMGLKLRCSKPPNYGLHFRISPESTTFSFPATMHVNFSWSRYCIFLVRLSEPLGLETLLFLFRQWPVNKEALHN